MEKNDTNIVLMFIFALTGLFIGAMLDGAPMAIALSISGIMAYFIFGLKSRIRQIENELKKNTARKPQVTGPEPVKDFPDPALSATRPPPIPAPQPAMPTQTEKISSSQKDLLSEINPDDKTILDSIGHLDSTEPDTSHAAAESNQSFEPNKPSKDPSQVIFQKITDFFTKGNIVVKVGVIVFFFGVGFLLKYAAEHSLLPIELRLCFSGICGLVLLGIGWRLRKVQMVYATTLQGAGIGVLYLTVFGAAKLYTLIPLEFAFFIMIGIVVFSGILAILQDARALAVFGITGGFLSPVLMSTGTGSHVALFSYYALLNLGIFGIAWFKSWRILNWIGFIFTFFIGFLWGYKYYRPQYFSTTEPFLILHFLFYSTISVLFAFRQPVKLKGYIDGTLVFGLPVIVFALQSALVKDMEFGMAFSALGAAGFYILLSFVLWKQAADGMKLLCESFLSLGVVFLSLAIPFAFDSGWTCGIWALEGAAILWIGLRQDRKTACFFGILLQAAAVLSFIHTVSEPVKNIPVANAVFLSILAISIAAFLTNFFLISYGWPKEKNQKQDLFMLPALWGFVWWFSGGIHEIITFVPHKYAYPGILAFISASCMVLSTLRLKLNWKDMEYPLFVLPYITIIITLFIGISGILSHPCKDFAWIAFLLVLLVQYHILFWHEKTWQNKITGYMHRATLYFTVGLICWQIHWTIGQTAPANTVWPVLSWGIIPAAVILFLTQWGHYIKWPFAAFKADYQKIGLLPVIAFISIWIIAVCFNKTDPAPLPFLPIFNPADLACIFCSIVIIKWVLSLSGELKNENIRLTRDIVAYLSAALVFLWMNALIAKCIHYFYQIPFTPDDMLDSILFQAGISILWTTTALGAMVFAHKKALRNIWFTGACLLAAAVLKLFLIDLVEIDTIARIVSFLVVGTLMLIIGYFSPLPPGKKETVV